MNSKQQNKSLKILIVPIVPIINNLLWTILTKQQDHRWAGRVILNWQKFWVVF